MKIVVWNECYIAGGADWALIDLITAWPNGNDTFLICINKTHEGFSLLREKTSGRASTIAFESLGEKVSQCASPEAAKKPGKITKYFFHFWTLFRLFFQYWKLISRGNTDLLLLNNGGYPGGVSNYVVALIATIKRIPHRVMIVHNYPVVKVSESFYMRVIRLLCHATMQKLVCVSESLKESIQTQAGIAPQKLVRIYNGINIQNKVMMDRDFDSSVFHHDGPKAGIIGSFEERKGHAVLFKAWSKVIQQIPDAKLFIIGSSSSGDKPKLLQLAKDLGISDSLCWVEFVRNIGLVYQELDVMVMPSRGFESFGRIVVETMAFGKTIVASRVGGIPELIEHGHDGFLFEKDNDTELAQTLIKILPDKTRREEIGAAGIKKYQSSFKAEKIASLYYDLIKQL